MELRAEIDRGDVWYDYPYTSEGRRRSQPVRVRPTLTLFARDGSREVAIARWPTTIGGWKPERSRAGGVGLRYKESPEGPRLWRDVVAAPAWLPPPSTPDDELVRRGPRGRYVPNTSLFGPSYRSAYGLAMVMNHRVIPSREEGVPPTLYDEGVRAHGSVSYGSILRGTSHGCHRLYNHLAVRMMGFLLAHRNHVRHGSMEVLYARRARSPTGQVNFRIRSRGYRYELTPPVEISVLRGNVLGTLQEAPLGMRPLSRAAQADATATAAADENLRSRSRAARLPRPRGSRDARSLRVERGTQALQPVGATLEDIYTSGRYADQNASYHVEDSPWKAAHIGSLLRKHGLRPRSMAEIGCGAGQVLSGLARDSAFSGCRFVGYDISPRAIELARTNAPPGVDLVCGDMIADPPSQPFDVLLCVDVFEHVPDYLGFLQKLRGLATHKVFHIPLDLHVSSVLRSSFLATRASIGHIHYFTAESAVATLVDAGYVVEDQVFTNAARDLFWKHPSLKKAVANVPRWMLGKIDERFAARVLGGYSLLVLAR